MSLGSWHGCSACFPRSAAIPPKPGDSTARLGGAVSANAGPGWFLLPRSDVSPRHSQSHPTPYSLPYPGDQHLGFPALMNHFSSAAHSEHSSCTVPAAPSRSILNTAWAMRMPASNCVVSKPYCLLAIFYKLIRIFIGRSVHDKKR